MTAQLVTHPVTGEPRLRHDPNDRGAYRLLNRSLALRALEDELLADSPSCACGAAATEIHRRGDICTVSGPYDRSEFDPVCRRCHDATLCTAPHVTSLDRILTFGGGG